MNVSGRTWVVVLLGTLAGIALGAGGVGLYAYWYSPTDPNASGTGQYVANYPKSHKQRAGGKATEVAALGRLVPRGDILAIGALMGDLVEKLDVEEGQPVTKGAVLGTLQSYSERLTERDAAAAQLDEAKAKLAAEKAYFDSLIKEADIGVRQAREIIPLDIKAQEARVALVKTEVETGQAELDRLRSAPKGSVIQGTIDQQAQLVRRSQQDLIAAKAQLGKMQGEQTLSLERAEANLEEAKAGRKKAEAAIPIESLTKNLALAEVRLARTILKAPRAGTILKILTQPGERVESKPILKLGDTSTMYIVAEVYETDALLVKPGQRVTATSPALPEPLTGTVERVGQIIARNDVLPLDPAADANARVVEAWVRLDQSEPASRLTNLQVDVLISLAGGPATTVDVP